MRGVAVFPWVYDLVMAAAEWSGVGRWRHGVVEPARGRVLEIGAGTGLNFRYYDRDALVIATDVDSHMLRRSRRRITLTRATVLLVVADAEALPFRAETFDEGVVGLALCTIPHPETALTELRRVLVPGSPVRLLEHVRVSHPVVGRLQDWLTPLWRPLAGGCRLNRRTADTIAASGFRIERMRRYLGGAVLAIRARTA